ncbi:CDP-alcohol phosphatidyltransferase family protein [Maribacter sp. ACAM166]|uniref:CDP-alcohol phosphatidyltransferase family protein n=1 Tax=Maribacter sp. ACAM166 TaxID=2508996 RepID=UPI0010FD7203|nr:CDP-alcohol phosphatidyltransferase family protein [Maribacter sp. ACAM166]TLP79073.1 CDP-alcohol phosphatidyltransferase family protein [Maribacter sp. ACAM166]
MPKLPLQNQFFDLSDYGRPIALIIAQSLKNTNCTPIHVTLSFVVSGLIAIGFMLYGQYWGALFFLILKSILDAADGELARIKNTPSHTGRYFDSISDFILNLFFILTIWHITNSDIFLALLAFVGIQLQGTLYNYYYVILRNRFNGDTTSRIFENKVPKAFDSENQKTVDLFYSIYSFCYGAYDRIIYGLDKNAFKEKRLPNWLMTAVSSFGLGFQLLFIGLFLVLGLKAYIIPFFIGYSLMIFVFILIRQMLNR